VTVCSKGTTFNLSAGYDGCRRGNLGLGDSRSLFSDNTAHFGFESAPPVISRTMRSAMMLYASKANWIVQPHTQT
jgi:hypothetical protein